MDTSRVVPPGTPLRMARRYGVLLEKASPECKVITTGGNVEQWPVGDIEVIEERAEHRRYLAAYVGKREEEVSNKRGMLEKNLKAFETKKKLIQRTAHTNGAQHGIGPHLDELLAKHGLEPRPLKIQRTLGLRFVLTSNRITDLHSYWPLRAAMWNVPALVTAERVYFFNIAEEVKTTPPGECDCLTHPIPEMSALRDLADRHASQVTGQTGWTYEIIGARWLGQVSSGHGTGGVACDHQEAHNATVRRIRTLDGAVPRFGEEFTEEPLPATHRLGAYIRVREYHWSISTGTLFRVTGLNGSEPGALRGTMLGDGERERWDVNPGLCDVIEDIQTYEADTMEWRRRVRQERERLSREASEAATPAPAVF